MQFFKSIPPIFRGHISKNCNFEEINPEFWGYPYRFPYIES